MTVQNALGFNSTADYLGRTTNLLNFNADYTVTLWAQFASFSDYAHFWGATVDTVEQGGNYVDSDMMGHDNANPALSRIGVCNNAGGAGFDFQTGPAFATGVPVFLCLRRTGNLLELFINGSGTASVSSSQTVSGRPAAGGNWVGRLNGGYGINGWIACVKEWQASLSTAEMAAEKDYAIAVRTANLKDVWNFTPDANRYIGAVNGYTWTANGTITDETGPDLLTSSATVEQYAFRGRADDGSESSATWRAAENTNFAVPLATGFRLRFGINTTGDLGGTIFRGEWKLSSDSVWQALAAVYGAPTVTWGAIGTAASGTTSCAPSYPSGIAALTSKIYCVVTGRSNTAATAPTMPAGWTSVLDLEDGVGTWAADTGTRRVTIFKKDTVAGTESGTVTVSLAGSANNTLRASIIRVEVPSGYSISESASTGADTTNGTGFSATGGTSLSWAADDLLLIAVAQNLDTGTQSSQAISATGATFGTRTNRASDAVTNGFDHRHILDSVPVTAGSGSSAPTYSYTVSAAASGPCGFLRLRAAPPAQPVALAPSANIAASAATATTAQLTAPSGKTTANFQASRISDDTNPLPSVDPTTDVYLEPELSVQFLASAAANGQAYDFRVTSNGSAFGTYTNTPRVTVSPAADLSTIALSLTQLTLTANGGAAAALTAQALTLGQQSATADGGAAGDAAGFPGSTALSLTQLTLTAAGSANIGLTPIALTLTQQTATATPSVSPALTAQVLSLTQLAITASGSASAALTPIALTLGQNSLASSSSIKYGLDFPGNDAASGSDCAMQWTGASLLNRNDHTGLWEVSFRAQLGYYAVGWHNQRLNIPSIGFGDWPASLYEFGTHPHPDDGTYDTTTGQASVLLGSTGATQFMEIAGLGANDFVASQSAAGGIQASYPLIYGKKYRQARIAETMTSGPFSGLIKHTFYPDLPDLTKVIVQYHNPFSGTPVNPMFGIGASYWTGDGNVNNETINGVIRAIKLFGAALTTTDILIESAEDTLNAAQTANTPHYINQNPTPSDISDKSGQGNHPAWRNGNVAILAVIGGPAPIALSLVQLSVTANGGGVSVTGSPAATGLVLSQFSLTAAGGASAALTPIALTLAQPNAAGTTSASTPITAQALTLTQLSVTATGSASAAVTTQALTLTQQAISASASMSATGSPAATALTMTQLGLTAAGGAAASLTPIALSLTQPSAAARVSGTGSPSATALTLTQNTLTAGGGAVASLTPIALTLAQNSTNSEKQLITWAEIASTYQGSFITPEEFGYSEGIHTQLSDGRLIMSGHTDNQDAAIISLPSVLDGSEATIESSFIDPTNDLHPTGWSPGDSNSFILGGILDLDGRTYFTKHQWYNAGATDWESIGYNTNFLGGAANAVGLWRAFGTGATSQRVGGWMAYAPPAILADTYTFLAGQAGTAGAAAGKYGPNLFAIKVNDAIGAGGDWLSKPLIWHDQTNQFPGWVPPMTILGGEWLGDKASGAVWIETATRKGVLFLVAQQYGGANTWYGEYDQESPPDPYDHDKGYHSDAWRLQAWLFDPADLMAVYNGTKNGWECLPYERFTLITLASGASAGSEVVSSVIPGKAYQWFTMSLRNNRLILVRPKSYQREFGASPTGQVFDLSEIDGPIGSPSTQALTLTQLTLTANGGARAVLTSIALSLVQQTATAALSISAPLTAQALTLTQLGASASGSASAALTPIALAMGQQSVSADGTADGGASAALSPIALVLTQLGLTASGGAAASITPIALGLTQQDASGRVSVAPALSAQALTMTQLSATATGTATANLNPIALTLGQQIVTVSGTGSAAASIATQALGLVQLSAAATGTASAAITPIALTLTQQALASETGTASGAAGSIALSLVQNPAVGRGDALASITTQALALAQQDLTGGSVQYGVASTIALLLSQNPITAAGDAVAAITTQALVLAIRTVQYAGPPIDQLPPSEFQAGDYMLREVLAADAFVTEIHAEDYFQ
jgi:hypothetical protein